MPLQPSSTMEMQVGSSISLHHEKEMTRERLLRERKEIKSNFLFAPMMADIRLTSSSSFRVLNPRRISESQCSSGIRADLDPEPSGKRCNVQLDFECYGRKTIDLERSSRQAESNLNYPERNNQVSDEYSRRGIDLDRSRRNIDIDREPSRMRVEASRRLGTESPRGIADMVRSRKNVDVEAECFQRRLEVEVDFSRLKLDGECSRRRLDTSSVRSVDERPRAGISKSASSLQSLVRRRSRRHGSSLPLELSTYSAFPVSTVEGIRKDETCTTSTLLYGSVQPLGAKLDKERSAQEPPSLPGSLAPTTNFNGSSLNSKVFGTAAPTLLRPSPAKPASPPSPPSWSNSPQEQDSDYIVDPGKGDAYCKGQFLGKGGFAKVYMITDVKNGSRYACKIIPKNKMQKIHMQKIAREIMIHMVLNHVNVVQMHHYFEDNLNVYMLLEACPRKSLMHVLKYRGKVTEPEARYYMKQMVTGVAYIHSQKVVHRDLKPGNMFLSDRMIVKIGDFGLATRPNGQRKRINICGTPNYIAPEVLYKQAYSYEADVWALGCILYALLVGQPPFDTATLKETYARICSNHYREVDDSIASKSGQDLIGWLLQPNPELRPSLERVKEHAYLTKEYVPASLPHTCCYQMPQAVILEPSPMIPIISSSTSPSSSLSGATRNREISKARSIGNTDSLCYQQQRTSVHLSEVDQYLLDRAEKNDNVQKESKVSNWIAKKLPKLPRFRQRLSNVLCPEQKKPGSLAQSVLMHRALENCVAEIKHSNMLHNPPMADGIEPLFVSKWIDYSNKYGLCFQLSDKSVGVLFNDNTKISYTRDRRRVEYMTIDDEVSRYHRERDVPAPLHEKLELLRQFTQYMDYFLTEGGEFKESRTALKQSKNACVPRMRRWLRTDKAIVMELTAPLLQVNFFVDHTKMVISQEARHGYLVTYIDTDRRVSSYWLNDLRDFGCTLDLYKRLHYVCKVAREFAELDNNTISRSLRSRRRSNRSLKGWTNFKNSLKRQKDLSDTSFL
ncbi:serine/threonine-protein kinase PLK1-like [Prorops nasuta]|uniref:serine/threonine-protein kinase PLK1-like n=1 Tax=Prorops nasuta TaxID=863751 RepID=UPI0034CE5C89